jgi:4-amino-4-deoxy-L-arabinose transferase-like glycosyltransferase
VTTGWHAADYGSIARNYYENGFRFLYPQIDWGGDGPGYVEMEFPLTPFLTALIYGLVGAPDDRWAVVIPFATGVLTACYTFWLGRLLFGSTAGLVGALLVAVSPVFVRFTQLTFPEGPLLACSAAAIFYVARWQQAGALRHLLVGAVCASLAVLFKPTALVLGLPIAWLFWLRYRMDALKTPLIYLFGVIVLLPPFLWYSHALNLALTYGNSFGVLFGGGSSKMLRLDLLLQPGFYLKLAARLTLYHLTLGGMAGVLWAVVRCRFTPEGRTVLIWAAATLASFFVVTMGNDETAYYQLPIVVPGCLLAGVGLVSMHREFTTRMTALSSRLALIALVGLVGTGVVLGTIEHYYRSDYVPFTRPVRISAQALGTVLRPGARIIYSEQQETHQLLPRGQHVTPPFPFYFSGHKGWYLSTEWVTAEELRQLKERGGEYFVVADFGVFERAHPTLVAWLDDSYARRPLATSWVVWDLMATRCDSHQPQQCGRQ